MVTLSSKYYVFEVDLRMVSDQGSQSCTLKASFLPRTLNFLTVTEDFVRVWDAITGKLIKSYQPFKEAPISAVCPTAFY